MLNDEEWEKALIIARKLGKEHSIGAERYVDLSGQWADEPNWEDILREICNEANLDYNTVYDLDDAMLIIDEYEDSYNEEVNNSLDDLVVPECVIEQARKLYDMTKKYVAILYSPSLNEWTVMNSYDVDDYTPIVMEYPSDDI